MIRGAHAPAFVGLAEFDVDANGLAVNRSHVSLHTANALSEAAAQEGYERGLADGQLAERQQGDARLSAEREEFERRLADARDDWHREIGAQLAADIEKASDELARILSNRVASILEPLIDAKLCERTIDDLERTIMRIAHESRKLKVHGRADLVQHVRDVFEAHRIAAEFEVAETTALLVEFDETSIELNLDEWLTQLKAQAQ